MDGRYGGPMQHEHRHQSCGLVGKRMGECADDDGEAMSSAAG